MASKAPAGPNPPSPIAIEVVGYSDIGITTSNRVRVRGLVAGWPVETSVLQADWNAATTMAAKAQLAAAALYDAWAARNFETDVSFRRVIQYMPP
jgi:hypothetical protein